MRWDKRLLRSPVVQNMAGTLVGLYAKLIEKTGSQQQVGAHIPAAYWDEGKPVIIALWHGRLLLMHSLFLHTPHTVHALISAHRDGRIVSRAANLMGVRTITGSSNKGGAKAVKDMMRRAKDGHTLFITPDGPRGPRMRASKGIVDVARMTGLPIIPATISYDKGKMVQSWDRFLIPRPFSRGVVMFGDALYVPRDAKDVALESHRQKLEDAMNTLQQQADDKMGRTDTPLPAKEPS